MDDFTSGAMLAHIINSGSADSGGNINEVLNQQVKNQATIYAKYTEAVNSYNALVKRFNTLVETATNNEKIYQQQIAALQQQVETLKTAYEAENKAANRLHAKTIAQEEVINLMAKESEKAEGHDERPLSSRKELRTEMIQSIASKIGRI